MRILQERGRGRWLRGSPLRRPVFRRFYVGMLGTALGYTMQTTLAAWVMTSLTASPLFVALVQSAGTAPTLAFGLVAGALADTLDRRRLMLVTQSVILGATVVLGLATLLQGLNPWSILVLTFVAGSGLAFYLPAQGACINDLVPRDELPAAVSLNAVAFNLARAVGPAVAGGLAAALSAGIGLLAAAACFVLPLLAVVGVNLPNRARAEVGAGLFASVAEGLRFVWSEVPLRSMLLRNVSFSFCASAIWCLLPLIARQHLGLGARGYGMLSGAFGVGAIFGAAMLPRVLQRCSPNVVVVAGCALVAAASVMLAVTARIDVATAAMGLAGMAWVGVLASLSVSTQSLAPAPIRARAFAAYLVANQSSLAVGSACWGAAAGWFGTRGAMAGAAIAMAVLLLLGARARIVLGTASEVEPVGQTKAT